MNTLKDFSITIYSDNDSYNRVRDMISFDIKCNETDEPGLKSMWFFFSREEFESLVNGKSNSAIDGYHSLRAFGDLWTFYDMEWPRESKGVMKVPYFSIAFPQFIQELILKAAKRIWALYHQAFEMDPEGRFDRFRLDLPQAMRDRWVRLYGRGKGKVVLEVEPQVKERFDEHMTNEQFRQQIDYLKQVAQNMTIAFFETSKVVIQKDWDGYYFKEISPSGKVITVGGVVNHAREPGKFDWSTHT